MATTEELIEKLELAIASGVKEFEYDNRKMVYRNMDDMMKALQMLRRKVAGKYKPLTIINPRTSKGLD